MKFIVSTALALALAGHAAAAAPTVAAALADPSRPAADTARDAVRHPAELMAFAGVKPGDSVIELLPGTGYFTRIFAKAVGPGGHVYAAVPAKGGGFDEPEPAKIAAEPGYGNLSVIELTRAGMAATPPADVLFTSQNYHDFHLSQLKLDVAGTDQMLFASVKPGGTLVLVDHVAKTGAPVGETADKLHRIDPAVARAELEAVGFRFDGETSVLRNPADAHDKVVFDPAIRGHTDQFAYRFKKPR